VTGAEVLEVTVHIAATPDTVFPYFIDPDRYVQWMGDRAMLNAVPGGVFRVRMRDGVEAAGVFVEVDAPRRVVFTWGWTHGVAVAPGSTRVVVTLEAENGGTRGGATSPRLARRRAACPPPQGLGDVPGQAPRPRSRHNSRGRSEPVAA
jgi:uncharacterized protein YndB with AHSA1/START domain